MKAVKVIDIKEHLDEVLLSVDETFTDISKEYIVVIG